MKLKLTMLLAMLFVLALVGSPRKVSATQDCAFELTLCENGCYGSFHGSSDCLHNCMAEEAECENPNDSCSWTCFGGQCGVVCGGGSSTAGPPGGGFTPP